ncbi:hypothetical protein [Pasteuria penetrans]|uniref:hypothetical protein n=1 Tax=Pasteuria penetrans TaxID=86005 RepID=UPI000FBFAE86|nr:hypothetical protein [Pasteuria penetrans]
MLAAHLHPSQILSWKWILPSLPIPGLVLCPLISLYFFICDVDDRIVHCRDKTQANYLLSEIRQGMAECGLELHPEKTKIFYYEDGRRSRNHDVVSLDSLGYTCRPHGRLFGSMKGLAEMPALLDSYQNIIPHYILFESLPYTERLQNQNTYTYEPAPG